MPIIIEILIFLGVGLSVIWAGIKHTAKTVSSGVKEKMQEREERNNPIYQILHPNPHLLFNNDEKEAIIRALFSLARSDKEYHPLEKAFIEKTAESLVYQINWPDLRGNESKTDKMFNVLQTMNDRKKDWFILYYIELMHVDGKVAAEELVNMDLLFYIAHINPDRVNYVLDTVAETIKRQKVK